MKDLKNRTIKAIGWDFVGRVTGQGVSFVISIFLARLLSPGDFGLLAIVSAIVAIAYVVMEMGFGSSLVQRKEVTEEQYGSVFVFNLAIGLFLAVLLFNCAGLLAQFYKKEIIANIARVMSLLFIIYSLGTVIRTKLYKELNFKTLSMATLISGAISGSIGVLMAFMGFGVWCLVVQSLLNPLLEFLFCFWATRWFPKFVFRLNSLKELWNYSFNIFISTIIGSIFGQIDKLCIGRLFAPANLGYYYRAKSMESLIYNYTAQSLVSAFFPAMSSVKDDANRFNSIVFRAFHIICFVSFSVLGILYLTSEDIIALLFSEKWIPSVPYFRILLLSSFAYPITALFQTVLQSKGSSSAYLRLTIIRYSLLAPTFVLLLFFGIKTYLYSFVVSSVLSLFFSTYLASRQMETSPFWFLRKFIPYIGICISVTGMLEFLASTIRVNRFLHLSLFATVFFICYFGILHICRIEGFKLFFREIFRIVSSLHTKYMCNKLPEIIE